jgi:quinol monooxygenase YgiN
MRRCAKCVAEHDLLDPTFRRHEAYVRLASELQRQHAQANDDLCRIGLPNERDRYFVRGVLPVAVRDRPDGIWWGLWAEVSEPDFRRILELSSTPDQASEPPIEGALANVVPGYADTLGLWLALQLTGPTRTCEAPPRRLQEVVAFFRDRVVPAFSQHEGFLGYRAYVDRERGRFIVISLWATRSALDSSGETARRALREAADLGARTVGQPEILELAFDACPPP